jgi:hypothetical protein
MRNVENYPLHRIVSSNNKNKLLSAEREESVPLHKVAAHIMLAAAIFSETKNNFAGPLRGPRRRLREGMKNFSPFSLRHESHTHTHTG